jgi:hypothetical protein
MYGFNGAMLYKAEYQEKVVSLSGMLSDSGINLIISGGTILYGLKH